MLALISSKPRHGPNIPYSGTPRAATAHGTASWHISVIIPISSRSSRY
jgi:hypothetical protein